jgi:prepilin-type N-terminal cleavage/methylation domain-containing protein
VNPAFRKPSRAVRGFTLVEMLAVIAVVASLVGLMLPALGSARAASERAACLGHRFESCIAH